MDWICVGFLAVCLLKIFAMLLLCNWPHLAWLAFYNWLVYQIIVHGVQLDPAAYVWPDLASRQCSSPRINNSWQLWSWSTCAAAAASLGHFVNTWIELGGISYEGHSQKNESNQIWQTIANASQSFIALVLNQNFTNLSGCLCCGLVAKVLL